MAYRHMCGYASDFGFLRMPQAWSFSADICLHKVTFKSLICGCIGLTFLHESFTTWSCCCKDVLAGQRDPQNFPSPVSLSKAIPHCPNSSWLNHQAVSRSFPSKPHHTHILGPSKICLKWGWKFPGA